MLPNNFFCLRSDNEVISAICRHSLLSGGASSPHGCNLLCISSHYQFNLHEPSFIDNSSTTDRLIEQYGRDRAASAVDDNLVLLLELLFIRERTSTFSNAVCFSPEEIRFTVNSLCTN